MDPVGVTVKNLHKCFFKNKDYGYNLSVSLKYNGGELDDFINIMKNEHKDQIVYISNPKTYRNLNFLVTRNCDLFIRDKKITLSMLKDIINSETKNYYTYDLIFQPYISKDNKYINLRMLKIKIYD